jgi:hypothetical protein
MKIVINIEELPEDLSPVDYVILHCLYYKIPVNVLPQELKFLEEKRYIKLSDSVELREKTVSLFEIPEDKNIRLFLEVFNTYPLKTYTGRRLRPKDINTKEFQEIYKKYKAKVLDKKLHSYVVKCLDNELKERKKANNLEFMHELITWVNGEKWDRYSVIEEAEENIFKKDI